jgi:CBS domain-containing protein
MQVREVMTGHVQVVAPHTTLHEAAELMRNLDVGFLPVCAGGRLVGMLTDRDVTVRGVAEGEDPWEGRVRDVMSPEVIYCFEDDDVAEAGRIMQENQVRRLPVLAQDRRLVGIVSLGDLAVHAADEHLSGDALRAVSEPG